VGRAQSTIVCLHVPSPHLTGMAGGQGRPGAPTGGLTGLLAAGVQSLGIRTQVPSAQRTGVDGGQRAGADGLVGGRQSPSVRTHSPSGQRIGVAAGHADWAAAGAAAPRSRRPSVASRHPTR
jgi:hypothetical protein